jgi:hypothetical protein
MFSNAPPKNFFDSLSAQIPIWIKSEMEMEMENICPELLMFG